MKERRRIIATLYHKGLMDALDLCLPYVPNWAEPVWHLFVVRTSHRDRLIKHLEYKGIQTLIHYPVPPHKQDAFREMSNLNLPLSEQIHKEVLSLPIGPSITEDDVHKVIKCIIHTPSTLTKSN